MRTRLIALNLTMLTAATGLVTACSGGGDGGDAGDTGNTGALVIGNSNIVEEFSSALCTQLLTCEDRFGPSVPDAATCDAALGIIIGLLGPVEDPSLYVVDSARAVSCLQKLENDCDFELNDDPDCEDAVTGALGQDDCCDQRGGCSDGLYCYTGTGGSTLGTCQPYVNVSGNCSAARTCDEGLFCNNDVCEPKVVENAACDFANPCEEGLYCDLAGTCEVLVENGSGCGQGFQCESGLCIDNECADAPLGGDACDTGFDRCEAETVCIADAGGGTDGICTGKAVAAEQCDADGITAPPCAEWGLVCNDATTECEEGPGAGDDCTADDTCFPIWELFCRDTGSGTKSCIDRVAEDGTCFPNETDPAGGCGIGLKCDRTNSRCVPIFEPPETCQ